MMVRDIEDQEEREAQASPLPFLSWKGSATAMQDTLQNTPRHGVQ